MQTAPTSRKTLPHGCRERLTIQAQSLKRKRQTETTVFDERFTIKTKIPLRKHGLICVLFYDRFRIETKRPLRKKTSVPYVFLMNATRFKQHHVTQDTTARLYSMNVKTIQSQSPKQKRQTETICFKQVSELKQNYRCACTV